MTGLERVIGYGSIKKELSKVIDILNNKEEYENLGIKAPRGLLLYGVPGVGKTLIANSFIEELNRNVIVCSKSKVTDNFANYIRESFNEACKKAPSVLLLDDMDKFSNEDSIRCDSEEYVTIQSCIDSKKDYDIFVIATANNIRKLPYSLKRKGRFDIMLAVNIPKGNDSKMIIKHYLESKKLDINLDVDVDFITKVLDGYSCSTLENVINRAVQNAFYSRRKNVEKEDILEACLSVLYDAVESDDKRPIENIKMVAYHEAGHVLVSEMLEKNSVVLATIRDFDSIYGGLTSYYQDETYWSSVNKIYNRIVVLLGGMAAIEHKFKEKDIGNLTDLERAYKIAVRLITENVTSSSKLYNMENVEYYNSDLSLYKQNKQCSKIIERSLKKAKKIIKENSKKLELLAEGLIEKEVLISNDIKLIMGG